MHARSTDHTPPTAPPLPAGVEVWLYAGPPFGPALFEGVVRRLGGGTAFSVVDAAVPSAGWQARGAAIATAVRAAAAPVVLVAHGLAVPAVIEALRLSAPALVLLSNGPITRLDPVSRRLAHLAPGVLGAAMFPALWLRWLASSAGLRRAVVNPYVMDHDTVATVCGEGVATAAGRRAAATYLRSLAGGLPELPGPGAPVRLIWAEDDRLYPSFEADFMDAHLGGDHRVSIPGARFAHPAERPWAFADAIRVEVARILSAPPIATAASRSSVP